jgi:hypothetical protein
VNWQRQRNQTYLLSGGPGGQLIGWASLAHDGVGWIWCLDPRYGRPEAQNAAGRAEAEDAILAAAREFAAARVALLSQDPQ